MSCLRWLSPASHHVGTGLVSRQSMWDFWSTKWHWKGFSLSTSVSLFRYHSINVPHPSASKFCSYEPDKLAKPGYIKIRFSRMGERSFNFSSSLQALLYLRCCPILCLCKCNQERGIQNFKSVLFLSCYQQVPIVGLGQIIISVSEELKVDKEQILNCPVPKMECITIAQCYQNAVSM
jgi:hypothetical protein